MSHEAPRVSHKGVDIADDEVKLNIIRYLEAAPEIACHLRCCCWCIACIHSLPGLTCLADIKDLQHAAKSWQAILGLVNWPPMEPLSPGRPIFKCHWRLLKAHTHAFAHYILSEAFLPLRPAYLGRGGGVVSEEYWNTRVRG